MNEFPQKKFSHKEHAFLQAKIFSMQYNFVVVIQSLGDFFVETEPSIIRSWEKELLVYSFGKKIFGDEK